MAGDSPQVQQYRRLSRGEIKKLRQQTGVSNVTINCELAFLRPVYDGYRVGQSDRESRQKSAVCPRG
jgi:hypothetical protein